MHIIKRILAVSMLTFVISACAASSGPGSAHLVAKNSLEVSLSPFYLVDHSAANNDHAWHLTRVVSAGEPIAGFLKPNQMLMESFTHWLFSLEPTPGKILAANGFDEIPSDCEGGYSAQMKMDSGGQFTGAMRYSDFADDCSLTINGHVPFTGSLDLENGEIEAELQLSSQNAKLGDKELQLNGELDLAFNAFKGTNQIFSGESEISLTDASGIRFRLDDIAFIWDYTNEYQVVTVNGLIHFKRVGSVRLETTSPLQFSNNPGRINSVYRSTGGHEAGRPAHTSHKRRLPFDGALLFHGADNSKVRLLFAKPAFPGFFWIDGSDGLQTMGTL